MGMTLQDANQDFKTSQGRGPGAACIRRLCAAVLQFVTALDEGNLEACTIAKAAELPASEGTIVDQVSLL